MIILLSRVEFSIFFEICHNFTLDNFTVLLTSLAILLELICAAQKWRDFVPWLRGLGGGLLETDIFVND